MTYPQLAAQLRRLRARQHKLAGALADCHREIDDTIAALRAGGVTVTAIAAAAGLSRQETHRRLARVRDRT